MDSLVSTEWLASELGASDLRVVDATWVIAGQGDPVADYERAHIPGAVFLDLEDVRDTASPLPMMLPPAEKFAGRMQSLGLGDGSRIVVYDNSPYKTAARAWFMFKTFGAHDVAILDGGFAKWRAEGRAVDSGRETLCHRRLTARADRKQVRTLADMKANMDSGAEQVVDARSTSRFTGEEPEPRAEIASGHIPGAHNVPIARLFDADGTYKSPEAIAQVFADAGVDVDRPIVTTCGSGVTASVLAFALHRIGKDAALYDGSWSEWGADPTTPKETGPA
ncbi:3-mercaptopyruvate sulfurtransferase [Sphingomonas sp.]|uniref:3-mercaptopyruvate sulfurtransferase n=1 Tax=Sphingomonas sp. TaxID=28214 RepID=UPI002BF9F3C5|nr:3-mercaptopyruvate sulfurtransferase [Sphingomonas sp.]HTG39951.1 3-mercaptopyruvate sulfurtransferase [Sphingomonas sp.]